LSSNSWLGRAAATPLGALAIAFVTWTLAAMDQSLFGYAVPGVLREFGVGLDVVGLMISASFVFGMLTPPVAGVLADQWGPRRILVGCLAISSVLVFAQGLATSIFALGLTRVLSYGFSAALSPITSALVANTAPPRHRALYVALLQCAYPFGWFLAAMAFIPLSAGGDWRRPFVAALLVLPVALVIWFLLPDARPGRPAGAAGPAFSLRVLFGPRYRRIAVLCGLAFFLYGGAIGGSTFYLPAFFQQERGYAADTASLIVGVTYAIAMVGYVVAALLSQTRFGLRRTTILWSGAGAVLFAISIRLPPAFATDVAVFGLMAMFFFGTSSILTTYLLEVFDASIRATAAGVCGSACLTAGFIVFPVLVARAVESWGWLNSFSAIVVPAALGACLVVTALPDVGRDPDQRSE
jgi:MFS family permease